MKAIYSKGEKMSSNEKPATVLADSKIDVKMKLAALWVILMLFYIYADILSFYKPGIIEELMTGEIAGTEVNQMLLLGSAILMTIPILMIFLSLTLRASVNRWTNIVVGLFHAVLLAATAIVPEEIWAYTAFFFAAEGLVIALIVWHAWKWPMVEGTAEK